ncbi:MAG TPA: hypothetical protein VGQ52_13770 [Gemmatimonadaceae bacterium]|jgi:hypothetical protein|nr:hypothetical protein [Gemmatimonadaceae bacterium]
MHDQVTSKELVHRLRAACIIARSSGLHATADDCTQAADEIERLRELETSDWYRAEDIDSLVQELDVLLNGEAGAARQARLCDIVSQVRKQGVVVRPAHEPRTAPLRFKEWWPTFVKDHPRINEDSAYEESIALHAWTAARHTDTGLLDGLEQAAGEGACPGIINDDNGHWAVSDSGIQNVPMDDGPADINTTFFVTADQWKPTIREAIRAYLDEDNVPAD